MASREAALAQLRREQEAQLAAFEAQWDKQSGSVGEEEEDEEKQQSEREGSPQPSADHDDEEEQDGGFDDGDDEEEDDAQLQSSSSSPPAPASNTTVHLHRPQGPVNINSINHINNHFHGRERSLSPLKNGQPRKRRRGAAPAAHALLKVIMRNYLTPHAFQMYKDSSSAPAKVPHQSGSIPPGECLLMTASWIQQPTDLKEAILADLDAGCPPDSRLSHADFAVHGNNYFTTLKRRCHRDKEKSAMVTHQCKIRERRVAKGGDRKKTVELWYDHDKGIPVKAGSKEIILKSKCDLILQDPALFNSEDEDPLPWTLKQQEEFNRKGVVQYEAPQFRRLKMPWRSAEATAIMRQIDAHTVRPSAVRLRWSTQPSLASSAPPTPKQIKVLLGPDMAWAVAPEWLDQQKQVADDKVSRSELVAQDDPNQPGSTTRTKKQSPGRASVDDAETRAAPASVSHARPSKKKALVEEPPIVFSGGHVRATPAPAPSKPMKQTTLPLKSHAGTAAATSRSLSVVAAAPAVAAPQLIRAASSVVSKKLPPATVARVSSLLAPFGSARHKHEDVPMSQAATQEEVDMFDESDEEPTTTPPRAPEPRPRPTTAPRPSSSKPSPPPPTVSTSQRTIGHRPPPATAPSTTDDSSSSDSSSGSDSEGDSETTSSPHPPATTGSRSPPVPAPAAVPRNLSAAHAMLGAMTVPTHTSAPRAAKITPKVRNNAASAEDARSAVGMDITTTHPHTVKQQKLEQATRNALLSPALQLSPKAIASKRKAAPSVAVSKKPASSVKTAATDPPSKRARSSTITTPARNRTPSPSTRGSLNVAKAAAAAASSAAAANVKAAAAAAAATVAGDQ